MLKKYENQDQEKVVMEAHLKEARNMKEVW